MSESKSELHKEFELERLILFSDAVFAIAITIIIIEIKFPELPAHATPLQILQAFKPSLVQFLGFIISFSFISTLWRRHLRLFRYLIRYNDGLIKRNSLFLFFVVCFPFSASGITEQSDPGLVLPLVIYMLNIALVFICQAVLCSYIFRTQSHISAEGYTDEKNYLIRQSKWFAVAMSSVTVVYIIINLFFPLGVWNSEILFFMFIITMVVMRRRLKKYKPASIESI